MADYAPPDRPPLDEWLAQAPPPKLPPGGAGLAEALSPYLGDRLTGAHGVERYRLWPERLARRLAEVVHSGVTAPRDALTGQLQVSDPETGMPTREAVKRAGEFAGAVMGGGIPAAEKGALGMAGGRLKQANAVGSPGERLEDVLASGTKAERLPGRGELPGSSGVLETPGRPNLAGSPIDTEPLQGLPRKVTIPGQEAIEAGPHMPAREAAHAYAQEAGLPYYPPKTYAKVDPERAARIAQAFEEMPHDPHHPEVQSAYKAMIDETMAQWNAMKKAGVKVEFMPPGVDYYAASPRLATEDVRKNNHLWVFPTREGFGSGETISPESIKNNPLLAETGEHISGQPALANDIFRAVHDYFGHIKEGVGFRAEGEENAWRSHSAMYTPQARRAMTTETRGQNSWLNYGPHGEANRTARTEDTKFADQKIGLLPDWVVNEGAHDPVVASAIAKEHPEWINTRLVTSKKAEATSEPQVVGLEAMKQAPEAYEHNVGLTKEYPNMPANMAHASTDEAAEHFIEHNKNNLLWLHDQVPADIRNRSSMWYEGGRKIIDNIARQYNSLKDSQIAGVIAALSPQKDWYQNVSLAKRVIDTNMRKADVAMTPEMEQTFLSRPSLNKSEYQPLMEMIRGKSLDDISKLKLPDDEKAVLKALWTRLYDESHNSSAYPLVTPEGGFGENVKTSKDTDAAVAWGSLTEISKAIRSIEGNGSRETMSPLMGVKHKVRNFYNNLLAPNSKRGDVTIDTHAVAAGLLRPFSGTSPEVAHNFANSLAAKHQPPGWQGAKGSVINGVHGTYPLYTEAYRRAAKERGILPRQMQSIAWEAVRGLFPENMKNKTFSAMMDGIWNDYRNGKVSLHETRARILKAAGGIRPPTWAGPAS